jgi:hypothetical protein
LPGRFLPPWYRELQKDKKTEKRIKFNCRKKTPILIKEKRIDKVGNNPGPI